MEEKRTAKKVTKLHDLFARLFFGCRLYGGQKKDVKKVPELHDFLAVLFSDITLVLEATGL